MPMPTKRTPKVVEAILETWAETTNDLGSILKKHGISRRSWYNWRNEDAELVKCCEMVEKIRADMFAELERKAAEKPLIGEIVTVEDGEHPKTMIRKMDNVERSKLMVQVYDRMKRAANPAKYSEKIQHTGDQGGPLEIVVRKVGDHGQADK